VCALFDSRNHVIDLDCPYDLKSWTGRRTVDCKPRLDKLSERGLLLELFFSSEERKLRRKSNVCKVHVY